MLLARPCSGPGVPERPTVEALRQVPHPAPICRSVASGRHCPAFWSTVAVSEKHSTATLSEGPTMTCRC